MGHRLWQNEATVLFLKAVGSRPTNRELGLTLWYDRYTGNDQTPEMLIGLDFRCKRLCGR